MKRNRTRVTPEIEDTRWDAIIIGSGLGGMSAAAGLAKGGKKVLLLEQHSAPGGYATSFRRKKFTFEVSLHKTHGLEQGQLLHKFLTDLGVMQKITPIPVDSTMVVKTPWGELSMGADYLEQLKALFPKEARAIDELDRLIDRLRKEFVRAMVLHGLPGRLYGLALKLVAPTFNRYADKTLAHLLDELFVDEQVKRLVAVQFGYFGASASELSAVLYLLAWGGFLKEQIFYIKGTSQALSNAFIERLEEQGGQLLLNQRAVEIVIEDGRAVGVRSTRAKGKPGSVHEFRAPIIVSNASPAVTFGSLVTRAALPASYLERMDSMEASASCAVLYVGLDCRLSELSGEDYHSVTFLDENQHLPDFDAEFQQTKAGQTNYRRFGITDYTALDPSLAPEGKSCLMVITLDFMGAWDNLSDSEYSAKKEWMVQEMLDELEHRYPGFRDHIEVLDAATPRTMRRYTSNHDGAFNGFAFTPERIGKGKGGLATETPIKGLSLTGAWVGAASGGFFGCIVNGCMAAKRLLRNGDWKPAPTGERLVRGRSNECGA